MTLETDIKRIEKLASQKEDANWRFRSFLKGCDLSTKKLDAVVHGFYSEISEQVNCQQCANCCKVIKPLLKAKDVDCLAEHLKVPTEDFIDEYLVEEEPEYEGEDTEGSLFKASPCPFLSNNSCTVYSSRPQDCCSYPHLHKNAFTSRLIGVLGNCSVCPIVSDILKSGLVIFPCHRVQNHIRHRQPHNQLVAILVHQEANSAYANPLCLSRTDSFALKNMHSHR